MALKDMETFDLIINKIEIIINSFEKKRMDEKVTRLFLSNGDSFNFSVSKNNVAHLLGININYLQSTGLINNNSSYNVLKELCKRKPFFRDMIKNNKISLKNIFSTYINQKIDHFFDNISIDLNNTNFVCKYDRNIAINQGFMHHDCEYIICKRCKNDSILLLELKLNGNKIIPMSNKIFSDENEAAEYFDTSLKKQTLMILCGIKFQNDEFDRGKNIYLNPIEKENHLLLLENYKFKYNCYIDIINEYKFYLKNNTYQRKQNAENETIINNIINCITNNTIITEKNLDISDFDELPEHILMLVNALNNNITSSNNKSGKIAYSKLQEQVARLQSANDMLKNQKNQLQDDLAQAELNLNESNKKFEEYEDFISTVGEAYKKLYKK